MMNARKQGFQRIKIDGKIHDLNEILPQLDKNKKHDIEIVVDRIVISKISVIALLTRSRPL